MDGSIAVGEVHAHEVVVAVVSLYEVEVTDVLVAVVDERVPVRTYGEVPEYPGRVLVLRYQRGYGPEPAALGVEVLDRDAVPGPKVVCEPREVLLGVPALGVAHYKAVVGVALGVLEVGVCELV